jgi:hypothetical protein
LGYFSTLKKEAACLSEISVDCRETTLRYIQEPPLLGPQILHVSTNCVCMILSIRVVSERDHSGSIYKYPPVLAVEEERASWWNFEVGTSQIW